MGVSSHPLWADGDLAFYSVFSPEVEVDVDREAQLADYTNDGQLVVVAAKNNAAYHPRWLRLYSFDEDATCDFDEIRLTVREPWCVFDCAEDRVPQTPDIMPRAQDPESRTPMPWDQF